MKDFSIRRAAPDDLPIILRLFEETIQKVSGQYYTAQQIEVWVSSKENQEKWRSKISTQYFIIVEREGEMVGFSSLEKPDYLDFMFVHHDFQGMGIATILLQEIEQEARKLGVDNLFVEASITARPFFERRGF